MSLIFLGGMYPNDLYEEIFEKSKGLVSFAANKYQWNLLRGLDQTCCDKVIVISTPFINAFPSYKDVFIKKTIWKHNDLDTDEVDVIPSFINIRGIRQVSRYYSIRKTLIEIIEKDSEVNCILLYSLDYAFLKSVTYIKKKYNNIKIFAFVPDLPSIIAQYKTRFDLYHTLTKQLNLRKVDYYRKNLDGYILMAEQMSVLLNISKKQYCIVDGICDPEDFDSDLIDENTNDGLKRIVYTGTLNSNSGVDLLLNAFAKIEDPNYRLVIAGAGYFEDLIKKMSSNDQRIHFLGALSKEKVKFIQQKATVLVNPRPTSGVDSAYSFPSKTIEYLLSGKPVAMFRLAGISDDYYKYIYQFNGKSPIQMAELLCSICNTNEDDIALNGKLARQFILNNKNYYIQAKKINTFIYNITGYVI